MEDKNKDVLRNNCPTAGGILGTMCPGIYMLDDDTNEQLMKLMEDALEGGYNRWRYEVLRNGLGPSK
ncbi:unnamed protein product [Malus baccata var. baccata]